MVYAAIFAGGVGSRMGSLDTPKQYLKLGTKPIIIHTIEKFYINSEIDKIIVLCPKQWITLTKDIVKKYLPDAKNISVIKGGETRNDTLACALEFIEANDDMNNDTIIITHDAVRPFVTHRIIDENIKAARQYGACDTVVEATDTIVQSVDNKFISTIPERKEMYQGQTPQTFRAKELSDVCSSLSEEEKNILTDACKIYTIKNRPVYLVNGEVFNIKITYPFDLKVANVLLEGAADND